MTAEASQAGPRPDLTAAGGASRSSEAGSGGHGPCASHSSPTRATLLRRPGRLRPAPLPRTGPSRPPRRGDRRPALPGPRRGLRRSEPHRAAQPRPLPPARPLPHPEARRVPGLDRRPRGRHHVDRRLPRAPDLLAARPPPSAGPARRLRRRPRQPDAGLRAAGRHRRAPGDHRPPPDHRGPPVGAGRGRRPRAPLVRAPLVRLHPHAEARRAPPAVRADRLRQLPPGDRRPPRRTPGPSARRPHRRRHRPVLARPVGAEGAGPDRHHLQRRRAAQGPGLPRRGAGQGAHRAPRRPPRRRRQAARRGARRPGGRAVRPRRRRPVRQGHLRRRTGRSGALRRGRLRAVPVRGLLAAGRRGDGDGHAAAGHDRRGDPEVAGPDGETCLAVPPGDAGALAAGLGRLLGDRELRTRLGRAGRERVLARFTWAKAAEGTVAHYREAIARSGGTASRRPERDGRVPAAAAVDVVSDRESRATC